MKNYLILISLALLSFKGNTQQDPLFTQFWQTQQYFNPATTGLNSSHEANALARWQWDGVNGAPNSQLVTYGAALPKFGSGIGLSYLHDKIGFSEMNRAVVNYAYHMKVNRDSEHQLSIGLSAGIEVFSIDFSQLVFPEVPETIAGTSNKFTADLGISYKYKALNLGISSTHLNEPYHTNGYQSARHYYLFSSYTFKVANDWQIRPQLQARTDLVKMSFDVNVTVIFQSKYHLGISYRTSDALCFNAAFEFLKKFKVGYAYDLTINKLSSVSKGSHEIHLGFKL